jgi:hypothetical protein
MLGTHDPETHPWPVGHALVQLPQWALSFEVSEHV